MDFPAVVSENDATDDVPTVNFAEDHVTYLLERYAVAKSKSNDEPWALLLKELSLQFPEEKAFTMESIRSTVEIILKVRKVR